MKQNLFIPKVRRFVSSKSFWSSILILLLPLSISAQLSVELTLFNTNPAQGQTAGFKVKVMNNGTSDVSGITGTFDWTVPAGGSMNCPTTWNIPTTLGPGDMGNADLFCSSPMPEAGDYTATATVTAPSSASDTINWTAVGEFGVPVLEATVTASPTMPSAGQTVTFTYSICNLSPQGSDGNYAYSKWITADISLPPGFTYVSGATSPWMPPGILNGGNPPPCFTTTTTATAPSSGGGDACIAITYTDECASTGACYDSGCTTVTVMSAPTGSLSVSKTVTGAPSGYSGSFDVEVDCSDDSFDQTLTISNGSSQTITDIPAGTTCTTTEPNLPAPPNGYSFGTPTITPSNVTITANQTASVTVTNPLTLDQTYGTLQVNKVVTGAPGGYSQSFDIEVSCTDGTSQTLTITNGSNQTISNIETGATCTVIEPNLPTPPSGYTFGTPTITPNSIVIGNNNTVTVTVTNPLTAVPLGSIRINKVLNNPPVGYDTSTQYEITLDCDNDTFDNTFFITASSNEIITDVPLGTSCSVFEDFLPNPPNGYSFNTPTVTPSSFTVNNTTQVTVNVVNSLTADPCALDGFTINENCNDNGTSNDTADDYIEYSIFITGTNTSSGFGISTSAGTVSPTTGSYNTNINVRHENGSASGPNRNLTITDNGDNTCTVTQFVTAPGSCSTPTPKGSLKITKTVTGAPAGFVSPGFDVVLDCSDDTFDETFNIYNTGMQTVNNIPVGTTCTITEPTLPTPPAGYSYGTPTITPSNITIVANQTINITVTNTLSQNPTGAILIQKVLNGGPGGITPSFTINLNCDGTQYDQSVNVAAGAQQTVSNLPVGLNCTITEPTLPTPPSGYTYGTPSISPATVTVGNGTTASVTVTNTLSQNNVCTLNNPVVVAYCNTNLNTNPADDTFGYTIMTTGTDTSSTYNISGDDTRSNVPYGSVQPNPPAFGWYPLSQGALVLNVVDSANPSCSSAAVVIAPDDCTFCTEPDGICEDVDPAETCTITAPNVTGVCNNNGTPNNPADDTFTYSVNVTHTGTDPTLLYNITGVTPNQTNLTYGTTQGPFGPFPIGGGNLSLTAIDVDIPICNDAFTVTAPAPCSSGTPQADLRVQKTVSSTTVVPGQSITYTITVTNDGPDAATNVQISDLLSTMLTYVSHTQSTGSYNVGSGIWAIPALVNGASATLQITVTVN